MPQFGVIDFGVLVIVGALSSLFVLHRTGKATPKLIFASVLGWLGVMLTLTLIFIEDTRTVEFLVMWSVGTLPIVLGLFGSDR